MHVGRGLIAAGLRGATALRSNFNSSASYSSRGCNSAEIPCWHSLPRAAAVRATGFCRRWSVVNHRVASHVRLASTVLSSAGAVGQQRKIRKVSMLFLFVPCVATFGLGTWQLFRRQWKIDVLDYRQKRLEEEPIPLVSAIEVSKTVDSTAGPTKILADDLEFRKVICEGVYDYKKSLYVGPRARSAYGVTQKGYYVITPLSAPDGSKRLLF